MSCRDDETREEKTRYWRLEKRRWFECILEVRSEGGGGSYRCPVSPLSNRANLHPRSRREAVSGAISESEDVVLCGGASESSNKRDTTVRLGLARLG